MLIRTMGRCRLLSRRSRARAILRNLGSFALLHLIFILPSSTALSQLPTMPHVVSPVAKVQRKVESVISGKFQDYTFRVFDGDGLSRKTV